MKNKDIILFILALGTAFFIVSCKSAPAAVTSPAPSPAPDSGSVSSSVPPPAPVPAPVSPSASPDGPDQAALNSLALAKARAESARQKTVDFESSSYLPDEWETAEAGYVSAGEQAQDTLAGVKQAEAGYTAAADSFEDIFSKTIPLYAQKREDEVIAARNGAISAGIEGLYAEYLRAADSVALDAADKYEAGDYYAAKAAADLGFDRYRVLKIGIDAYNVRQEILDRKFADNDPDNFDQADETLIAAFDRFEAGNIEEALEGAGEAQLLYNQVLKAGWTSYAAERAAAAGKERQNALDVKADIAVRNEFEPADKLYTQAAASLKAEKYEESAGLYSQSESRFIASAQTAVEKRRIAAEAIRAAEEKMVESEETARDAELILEGGV
ncbi:hypothetical protein AGMMS49587_12850 [Spirochaetia bacterium]|nr:hypothetical protein AGMMS49587_12850 [Spirochaetia bacterium]